MLHLVVHRVTTGL